MERKECVLLSKVSETSFSSPIRSIDPRGAKDYSMKELTRHGEKRMCVAIQGI
jgi:hypothetical protein